MRSSLNIENNDTVSWFSGIPILMYHEIVAEDATGDLARRTQAGYLLSREAFRQQMQLLVDDGFNAISLDQLLASQTTRTALPAKPVIITFDDGMAGNYRHALPILKECRLAATFFVISDRIGEPHMMTWRELDEMRCGGMSVGSHTASHFLLSALSRSRTEDQLQRSKKTIEDRLGCRVDFLSLPYGDSNRYYREVAMAAGYRGGCGSTFGFNQPRTDRYHWHRIAIRRGIPINDFKLILRRSLRKTLPYALVSSAKRGVARAIGKKNYDRLYNYVYGVNEQLE